MRVVIINYGMGNIRSIFSTLKYLGLKDIIISNKSSDVEKADKLILPGVGSFALAMNNIKKLNLQETLKNSVILKKTPILGICLGMQLLGLNSDEDGFTEGLGLIPGLVRRFNAKGIKIPHIGFDQIILKTRSRLFKDLSNFSDFYFVHSYAMQCNLNINQTYCNYGKNFISSYEVDNIAGVQFHPELSQTNGLKLLENFIKGF